MELDDYRPRCESCKAPMLGVVFRIYWADDLAMFDVCENCAPVPGDHQFKVIAIRYDRDGEQAQHD